VTSFITAVQNKESNFNLTNSRLRLVSGTTNPKLAEEIASYLGIENVPLIRKDLQMENFMFKFSNLLEVAMYF